MHKCAQNSGYYKIQKSNKKEMSTSNLQVTPEDFNKKSSIEKNFDLVRKSNDPRFGNIAIIQEKSTGDLAMLKEKVTNSEKEAKADILQAKRRLQMDHPYIQKMFDYSCHQKNEFCSKFFKVRGFYELPRNDLKKEIAYRKKNLQEFDHEELTHMAYQNLSALEYLQDQGTPFNDLKPNHISVDNSTQTYKLLDRLNDPSPVVQAQMNNIMASRPIYTSPAVFAAVKSGKKKAEHDPHKTDCFALGMSLLEAGTLDNVQDVYNHKDGTINEDKLDQHIQHFRSKYEEDNALLCDLTENLLTVDESKRFNPKQFNDELPSYNEIQSHFENNPIGTQNEGQQQFNQAPQDNFQQQDQAIAFDGGNQNFRQAEEPVQTYQYEPQTTYTQSKPVEYQAEPQVYRTQAEPVQDVAPAPTYTPVEPAPVTKTTVVETTQPATTTYTTQAPVITQAAPITTQKYVSSQPTVVRQQYTPAPITSTTVSSAKTLFSKSSYRPKKVFRYANPDYNWSGPVVGADTSGQTQLVRQAYGGSQYLTTNTVKTTQPSIIRTSQSSRVVNGGTTYTSSQPKVIRKSYNTTTIPSSGSYTTTNGSLGTTTNITGQKQVMRYRQDANGNLVQISGPPTPLPTQFQSSTTTTLRKDQTQ